MTVQLPPDVTAWRVASMRVSHLKEIAWRLERAGFATYRPIGVRVHLQARLGPKQRGRKIVSYPVLGGYMFVGERGGKVLGKWFDDRIIAILGDSQGPFEARESDLIAIMAAEAAGKWDERSREHAPLLAVGQNAKIVTGHLAGFYAVILELRSAGVKVDVDIFGSRTKVVVDPSSLEAQ